MNPQEELDRIVEQLTGLAVEEGEKNLLISEKREQIRLLRDEIYKLEDEKRSVRHRFLGLETERDRKVREIALWNEEQRIDNEIALLRGKVDSLIADAPWKDIAFDWQVEGATILANARRGLLTDERGLGKTLTSLIYRRLVQSKKTLYLTRAQIADDSLKEIAYREPNVPFIPMVQIDSAHRKTLIPILKEQEELIVVANFEAWRRNQRVVHELLEFEPDTVILDEAHRIMNYKTATSQGFQIIAKNVDNVLALTGTPIKNKPQELFSILHALYPEVFQTETKFLEEYCTPISQNKWEFKKGGLDALRKRLRRFFVGRSGADVGRQVPPPAIHDYILSFDGYDAQREAYELMKEWARAKIAQDEYISQIGILAQLTRLRQITAWPEFTIREKNEYGVVVNEYEITARESAKADWAEDLIKELMEEDRRVVLFSNFIPPVEELARRMKDNDISFAVITGKTERWDRKEIVDDFDIRTPKHKRGKYNVLLATYDTIGEGINLNAARDGILYDSRWNPAGEQQATGRLDRLNSIDQATIHRAAIQNTVDTWIWNDILKPKQAMIEGFKSAMDMRNTVLEAMKEGRI